MSSEFRAAVRRALPKARISVDHWHVVRLANEMVTKVRRRRVWELHQRRGRIADIPWKNRKLLAARDTPTFQRECARLEPAVKATRLPEPVALFKTLTAWRRELLTFLPHEG
jgi:transposase